MKIKLFATDLDGTLFYKDSETTKDNIEALKKLKKTGVRIAFVSGRVTASPSWFAKKIDLDCSVIGGNGAVVQDEEGTVIYEATIPLNVLESLYDFCVEHHFYFHMYDRDTYYSNVLWMDRLHHFIAYEEHGYRMQINLNINKNPLEEIKRRGVGITKFQILAPPERLEMVHRELQEIPDIYHTTAGWNMVEIGERSINKWNGLKKLAHHYDLEYSSIACIGDQENDIPMIQNCGMSFAIQNAPDKVKEFAQIVTRNDTLHSGVAEAVEQVIRYNEEN